MHQTRSYRPPIRHNFQEEWDLAASCQEKREARSNRGLPLGTIVKTMLTTVSERPSIMTWNIGIAVADKASRWRNQGAHESSAHKRVMRFINTWILLSKPCYDVVCEFSFCWSWNLVPREVETKIFELSGCFSRLLGMNVVSYIIIIVHHCLFNRTSIIVCKFM